MPRCGNALAFVFVVIVGTCAWAQGRPANDDFVAAAVLSGASGSVEGVSRGASREASEPWHAGVRGGASVWWRWSALAFGRVTFETLGSDFDTVLAVYTGPSLGDLRRVASNDDAEGLWSQVVFEAGAGVKYVVAVDGYGGETGRVRLSWRLEGAGAAGPDVAVDRRFAVVWDVMGSTVGVSSEVGVGFEVRSAGEEGASFRPGGLTAAG